MNADVLILASLYDLSADLVCAELAAREMPFVRINRETLAESRVRLLPTVPCLEYRLHENEWQIDQPKSVWYRQPTFLRNTPGVALSVEEQLDRSQWMAFLRATMVFGDALWLNHPQATYLAESKPLQLQCALSVGFKTPQTIVTNDARAVTECQLGDPIVVKSVDTILLHEHDDEIFAYTSIVPVDECDQPEFAKFPATCQELLQPKLDLRATVVGDQFWCVSVTEQGKPIDGDWRLKRREHLQYSDYELPHDDIRKCKRLVKKLGLHFGAIDLAVTDNGVHFIELNPTGEWGWLDSNTRPIASAIAGELVRGRC